MRIRNRYDADVPMVVGPVARRHPVYVDDARFLRGETATPVKYTLPGPMTMVDTLYDAHYRSREKLALAFAEILNEEARAIAAAGVDVIQFDEPAFNVYFDEVRDWGMAALERAAAGASAARPPCTSATATASRPTTTGRRRSAASGGSTSRRSRCSPASAIDQVSLECANSHVPIELIGLLAGKDVLVGAIDVATERVETPEEVAATIRAAMALRPGRAAVPLHQLRDGAACRGRWPAASFGRLAPGAAIWSAGNLARVRNGLTDGCSPCRRVRGIPKRPVFGVSSQRCFVSSTKARPSPVTVRDCGPVLFCP